MDIVIIALKVMGAFIALFIAEATFVSLVPGMDVPAQPLPVSIQPDAAAAVGRQDVRFDAGDTYISAWLYLPDDLTAAVPCIVMGHGFGGTKDMLLENYATRYRSAGYAVLAFDYRYFGDSGSEPRQLMLLANQLDDYRTAIAYVRSREEIDPARIALWGTSASGGYGIAIAAEDTTIACVVAQCPGLDNKASEKLYYEKLGMKHILRLFVHAQRDMGRSRVGLSPHKIPIVGRHRAPWPFSPWKTPTRATVVWLRRDL